MYQIFTFVKFIIVTKYYVKTKIILSLMGYLTLNLNNLIITNCKLYAKHRQYN